MTLKRKRGEDDDRDAEIESTKRLCKSTALGPTDSTTNSHASKESTVTMSDALIKPALDDSLKKNGKQSNRAKKRNRPIVIPLKPKPKIVKLAPKRPYPTVPTSSNATGPRSKRKEGNNKICVTRRTDLGAYLKRCKHVFVKEGFKELYLAAMGAAIPHAVMLATSLPSILPYDPREIKTSVTTGSVSVMDELVPVDEDDEGGTQTRTKASIEIIIRIVPGEGMDIDASKSAVQEYDSFSD